MLSVNLSNKKILWCNCSVDIPTQRESVATWMVNNEESLTHHQHIPVPLSLSTASWEWKLDGREMSLCTALLLLPSLGWGGCFSACHSKLSVSAGRAAETCLCHTGIWFLRPHLLPCCFSKHFQVLNLVRCSDKHLETKFHEHELFFACEFNDKSSVLLFGTSFLLAWTTLNSFLRLESTTEESNVAKKQQWGNELGCKQRHSYITNIGNTDLYKSVRCFLH